MNQPDNNANRTWLRKAVLTLVAVLLVLLSFSGLVDDIGQSYTEAGLKRALITFGVARGLNGIISVVQGTEVAVEPVGVGMTFTPGEILDPINDLIERFSWFVLASSTSLGVQKILLSVTAWHWFSGLMTLALLLAMVLVWRPGGLSAPARKLFYKLAVIMIALRFAVPLMAISSELVYQQFLEPQFVISQQQLEMTAQTIRDMNQEQQSQLENQEQGLLAGMKRLYQSASDAVDVEANIEAFKQAAANVSEHVINIIVVFAVQTLLFPLLFLWLLVQIVKKVMVLR